MLQTRESCIQKHSHLVKENHNFFSDMSQQQNDPLQKVITGNVARTGLQGKCLVTTDMHEAGHTSLKLPLDSSAMWIVFAFGLLLGNPIGQHWYEVMGEQLELRIQG